MGRKCAVPHCYTGYRKCKEKASLYKVPDDDFFLNKWQEAIAREDRPITPKDYVCDKHFKEDDIQRTRVIKNVVEVYLRPKLKPDAVPSIFPDLPEFILKMVKKRRKMLPQDIQKKNESNETKNRDEEMETDDNSEIKDESVPSNNIILEGTNDIVDNEIEIKSENESSEHDFEDDGPNRPKTYKCNECDYETKYPHNLRTHQTKHLTGEEAYIHCEICPDYKTKWELTYRNHMKIKHGVGSQEIFCCTLCDYKTRVKICLKRHMARHNKGLACERKFKCEFPECNYECDSKALLKVHVHIHMQENENKAFKCTECYYGTNSKTHILKHIKTTHNTGDDTVVSIGTKKSGELSNRKRRANGKPLYKCVQCTFQTHYHALLLKHLVKHREGELYPDSGVNISKVWKCSKCPYATFFQHALETHQETECEKTTLNTADEHNETDNDKDIFINKDLSTGCCIKNFDSVNDDEEITNGNNCGDTANNNDEKIEESLEETQSNHDEESFIGFQTVTVKEEHE